MRTLSSALTAAQKKESRDPAITIEAYQFGHPASAANAHWSLFGFEQLNDDSGSVTEDFHGCCIPADGSLNRVRMSSATVYTQRVASPGDSSDYTNWVQHNPDPVPPYSGSVRDDPVAIASYGTQVRIIWLQQLYPYGANYDSVCTMKSTDNGATWGSASAIGPGVSEADLRSLSLAYKDASRYLVVAGNAGDITVRESWGGTHSASMSGVQSVAVCHDSGNLWNIICTVDTGSYYQVGVVQFNDSTNSFTTVQYLPLKAATMTEAQILSEYIEENVEGGVYSRDIIQNLTIEFYKKHFGLNLDKSYFNRSIAQRSRGGGGGGGGARVIMGGAISLPYSGRWNRKSTLALARATDNEYLDQVYVCNVAGLTPIFSVFKNQSGLNDEEWFFMMKNGSSFTDYKWDRADKMIDTFTYGLALAEDGTYLWGTTANEVWRAHIPTKWVPPTTGTGTAESGITIADADILYVEEEVFTRSPARVTIVLDNSDGTYDNYGASSLEELQHGRLVKLKIGYENEVSECGSYFIKDIGFDRNPGHSAMIIQCTDMWGKLEEKKFPSTVEWNFGSDEKTAYEIIEMLVEACGGTLDNDSKSTLIDALYPRLRVNAGVPLASIIRKLLDMVEDELYFEGLTGYIIHPEVDDTPCYTYYFPYDSSIGDQHNIDDGSYHDVDPAYNRYLVIGKDDDDNLLYSDLKHESRISLLGESMIPIFLEDVKTQAILDDVAEAIMYNNFKSMISGFISVPYNAGMEPWDVITIVDSVAAQSSRRYRVMSYKLVWDRLNSVFEHRINLGAIGSPFIVDHSYLDGPDYLV